MLNDKLIGVLDCKWNMERPLCFIVSMLQVTLDIKGTEKVRYRIIQYITKWKVGKYQILISSTVLCALANLRCKRRQISIKERVKVFSSLVCRSKVRAAIRYVCERDKGGVLMLGDKDTKSSSLVSEALLKKHPNRHDVSIKNLLVFESYLDFINVLVTEENAEAVAKRLS